MIQTLVFVVGEVIRLDLINRFFNSAFAPPVFGALVGALTGVGATAYLTRVVQERLMILGREQQDRADAWDDLLKPLHDAVRDARWDLSTLRGFSRSWAYGQRVVAVDQVNDLFRDKSSHRLARFLIPEMAAINEWLMFEFTVAAHWSQSLSQRGPAGQMLFALLVEDTSLRPRCSQSTRCGPSSRPSGIQHRPTPSSWTRSPDRGILICGRKPVEPRSST